MSEAATTEENVKQETFAQSINFKQLFRVKGQKNLFYPISAPNKAKIIAMREFIGTKQCHSNVSEIERLEDFIFYKNDGDTLTITDVMDNINDNYSNSPQEATLEIMSVIVPNYDPEKFKIYHAQKVLNWYWEIKRKITENS